MGTAIAISSPTSSQRISIAGTSLPEQKRELIGKLIKADPTKSDRQIAKQVGASPTTAGKVRSDLEAKHDVSKVDTRTDTKGRQQPVHKPKTTSPPRPATNVEKVSTSAIKGTASKSTTSSKDNLAPQLNSLSWSDATPELRVKFIDNIGVRDLWHAMTLQQKSALINLINVEQDARNAVRAAS
jgi:hypothetical protein